MAQAPHVLGTIFALSRAVYGIVGVLAKTITIEGDWTLPGIGSTRS